MQINTILESMRSFGSTSLFVARNESSGLPASSMPSPPDPAAVVAVAFFVKFRYTMFDVLFRLLGGDDPRPPASASRCARRSGSYVPSASSLPWFGMASAPAPWDRMSHLILLSV